MSPFRLELSNDAERVFKKLSLKNPKLFQRVVNAFDEIKKTPYVGKPLKGNLKGKYSYRIGSYRVIYSIEKEVLVIYVIAIKDRKHVYQ